jgi:transcriptional regulator with XRE-family HTH domain
MITNERQYKITKAQSEKFKQTLELLLRQDIPIDENAKLLHKTQIDAIKYQIDDLDTEILEYETLKTSDFKIEELEVFSYLPESLIKARIVSGLTQKDLAKIIGVHEQQIQRYESTKYQTASLARIIEIAKALGVEYQKSLIPIGTKMSLDFLFTKLKSLGIPKDFVLKRLIPSHLLSIISEGNNSEQETALFNISSILGKIFNWKLKDIWGSNILDISPVASCQVSYKLPSNVEEQALSVYTVYAHYLSMVTLDITNHLLIKPVPTSADAIHDAIKKEYGVVNFEYLLRYIWSLGIPVLPLNDSGAFHGACWREDNRNIIVLKQKNHSESRWFFDLAHELFHAGENPEESQKAHLDVDVNDLLQQEEDANVFAGNLALEGKAEELVALCVKEAKGKIQYLKNVLPKVAQQENVKVGLLANYMAFRLSLQGHNWWGTAENLQTQDKKSLQIARDIFLENVDLKKLNDTDKQMLMQALVDDYPGG